MGSTICSGICEAMSKPWERLSIPNLKKKKDDQIKTHNNTHIQNILWREVHYKICHVNCKIKYFFQFCILLANLMVCSSQTGPDSMCKHG